MDMGEMKSKDIGNLMSKGLVNLGKEILANNGGYADIPQGEIPREVKQELETVPELQAILQATPAQEG